MEVRKIHKYNKLLQRDRKIYLWNEDYITFMNKFTYTIILKYYYVYECLEMLVQKANVLFLYSI